MDGDDDAITLLHKSVINRYLHFVSTWPVRTVKATSERIKSTHAINGDALEKSTTPSKGRMYARQLKS